MNSGAGRARNFPNDDWGSVGSASRERRARAKLAQAGAERRAYLSATSSKSKAFFGSAGTILKT
jgi:hypothetical protein